ncbi:hypothetical protein AAVH_41247, partial [Aphelenchoides avenae]
ELSGATCVVFVSLLNIVYSSFLMPAVGYLSEIRLVALRTEIVIAALLVTCALQIVVHVLRRVRLVQDTEETGEGSCMPNDQGETKPVNSPLL